MLVKRGVFNVMDSEALSRPNHMPQLEVEQNLRQNGSPLTR